MKLRIVLPPECMYSHKLQRKVLGLFWVTIFCGDLKACERAMDGLLTRGLMDTIIKEN